MIFKGQIKKLNTLTPNSSIEKWTEIRFDSNNTYSPNIIFLYHNCMGEILRWLHYAVNHTLLTVPLLPGTWKWHFRWHVDFLLVTFFLWSFVGLPVFWPELLKIHFKWSVSISSFLSGMSFDHLKCFSRAIWAPPHLCDISQITLSYTWSTSPILQR